MNHENESGPIWDEENAKWYAEKYGDHISNPITIRNANLNKDDHLLDIGCGTGTACREADKNNYTWDNHWNGPNSHHDSHRKRTNLKCNS